MARNMGVEVFAEELGLSHLVPVIQHELGEELQSLRLYTEVNQVIRQLRARGKRIAVCSNLAQAYGPAVRDLLPGLDGYALSYEVGAAKPDPATLLSTVHGTGTMEWGKEAAGELIAKSA